MRVYQSQPAPPVVAGWLTRIIKPAAEAIRLHREPPITELRPLGDCMGLYREGEGRVALDSRARYLNQYEVLTTWIHELAHYLIDRAGYPHEMHGGAFLALVLALYHRYDLAHGTDLVGRVSLYDYQDPPPDCWPDAPPAYWRPRVLGWAMATAEELATSELSAEAVARECLTGYISQCAAWAREPQERQQRAAAAARERERERERLLLWQMATGALTVLVVGLALAIRWMR